MPSPLDVHAHQRVTLQVTMLSTLGTKGEPAQDQFITQVIENRFHHRDDEHVNLLVVELIDFQPVRHVPRGVAGWGESAVQLLDIMCGEVCENIVCPDVARNGLSNGVTPLPESVGC
jgi:hypothetical protein